MTIKRRLLKCGSGDVALAIFRRLAACGVDIRAYARYYFQTAVSRRQDAVARYLISAGASPRALMRDAVAQGSLEQVLYLASLGADFRDPDYLREAMAHKREAIVHYLISTGGPRVFDACMRDAVAQGSLEKVQYLVSLGAGTGLAECVCEFMCEASAKGCEALARYLAERGGDLCARSTACVKAASRNGHLAVVRYLVGIGANSVQCLKSPVCKNIIAVTKYLMSLGHELTGYFLEFNMYEDDEYYELLWVIVKFVSFPHNLLPFEQSYVECRERNYSKRCSRVARAVYFWWVPRCFRPGRRSGRRMARRNFLEFRRLVCS